MDAASARAEARRSRAARGERPREKGFQDGMPARGDALNHIILERFRIQNSLIRNAALAADVRGPAARVKGRPSRRKSDFLAWLELQDFWSRLTRRLTARHLLEVGLLLCQ